MIEAFCLGGWGMYPTLFFGVAFIASAVAYVRNPARRRLVLSGVLSALTFAAGLLGFVTGLISTLSYSAGKPDQNVFIAQGTMESLHNIALALTLIVLGGIVCAFGAWHSGREKTGSSSPAPIHA